MYWHRGLTSDVELTHLRKWTIFFKIVLTFYLVQFINIEYFLQPQMSHIFLGLLSLLVGENYSSNFKELAASGKKCLR